MRIADIVGGFWSRNWDSGGPAPHSTPTVPETPRSAPTVLPTPGVSGIIGTPRNHSNLNGRLLRIPSIQYNVFNGFFSVESIQYNVLGEPRENPALVLSPWSGVLLSWGPGLPGRPG